MKNSSDEKLPRYNHYVPRFILDNFAVNNQLSIFDKHTLKQFKLPPYRAMGEKDFTNVRAGDIVFSFENRFTHIEDLAAPIIARIIKQQSLLTLEPMEEATLHTFVVVQFMRSKKRRLDFASVGTELRRRWPEIELNPHRDEIEDFELEKLAALNATFSKLEEMTSILVPKHCYLLKKNCPGEIYISDNPIVMHNAKQFGPYGNIGLAVPHIEIYYPLSPDFVLAYMCPLSMKEVESKQEAAKKQVNQIVGSRFLSPKGLSTNDKLEIEKSKKEIERATNYYAMIKNEKFAPIHSETLEFLNSLQIRDSFRHLASRKNDFNFAARVLSEKPNWKNGVGIEFS